MPAPSVIMLISYTAVKGQIGLREESKRYSLAWRQILADGWMDQSEFDEIILELNYSDLETNLG